MNLGGFIQCGLIALFVMGYPFLSGIVSAQVQRQDCMNQLQPCLAYLNDNNKPPDNCCRNLNYVIKSLPECLCSLMSIQGANQAERAGINVTKAQTLPGRCGQHINPIGCVVGTPNSSSAISRFQISKLSNNAAVAASAGLLLMVFKAL